MKVLFGKPTIIPFKNCKPPPKLSGHRIVCTHEYLYSFGGYSEQREYPLVVELWQFHLLRQEWAKISMKGEIPQEVASTAVSLINGHTMLLIGGTGIPFGQSLNAHVFVCNLYATDDHGAVTWKKLHVCGEIPEARYGQAVTVDDKYFYCVGGTDGLTYSMEVHRLNLETLRWERLASDSQDSSDNVPEARYRAEIVVYKNKLFVFGGGTPNTVFGFEDIHLPIFDLTTKKWLKGPPHAGPSAQSVPKPRKSHSVIQTVDREWAVIAGGIGDREQIFDDIWKFHLPTLKWICLSFKLPEKVYFHSAVSSSVDRMYIFGGVLDSLTHRAQRRTNKLSAVDLKPPLLQDMCLRRMVFEMPSLFEADAHGLGKLGISHVFFSRIIP